VNIGKFAVTRPVAVTMRIASLVLLGIICFLRLPVDLLPNVTLPTISVSTTWPNVAPEEIEAQVTRPLERAVSSVPNMDQVTSSSVDGSSSVRIQFKWGTDIGQAAVDVLQQVQRAQRSFPNDPTLVPPTVSKFDPNQIPILTYGVSGIDDPVKLRTLLDNEITPMLDSADGVAAATVSGGLPRAIMVNVDPYRLQAHHVSLATVSKRIIEENINLPAGIAKQGKTEYTIRSMGWFTSIDDIRSIPLTSQNGQTVTIGDIADVQDFHDEARLFTRLNSKPGVSLSISKQSGANTITTAAAVNEKLDIVRKLYPQLKFGLAYNQAQFVSQSVNNMRDSAIVGGVLAVLILLFFLRNIRSTLVVALSIPISITATFALFYMCGFTINTMSLGGLALSTGLIVDDAVVVLENIFRHIERDKKSSMDAAVDGTQEILSAVAASTWTVMVVFLPLLLIQGQAGQMYTQFALVVIFSLAISLLDAVTVVPMLSTKLISGEAHAESLSGNEKKSTLLSKLFARFGIALKKLDSFYRHKLEWAMHHRPHTLGIALSITVASFLLLPYIGTELMPLTDSGDFSISVKMPIGTALSETDKAMRKVEGVVLGDPNVRTAFAVIGAAGRGGGGGTLRPYQGSLTVKLKEDRKMSTADVIQNLRKKLSRISGVNARPQITDLITQIMTGGSQSLEVDIFGDDLSTLSRLSKDIIRQLRGIPGLENLDVNWQEAMPEIQWKVDRLKAQQMGLSFSDVANTINTATSGTVSSYYQESGFQYPIIVEVPKFDRLTAAQMKDLMVKPAGTNSQPVFLSQIATPAYGTGPSEITRIDRQRYAAVVGVPQGRSIGEVQADVDKVMKKINMPSGYRWDWGTDQKRTAEEFGGMWLAVVLAVGLIYMLLAGQFESFVHPLTILLSVPLAGSGVLLGLFLTGRPFGLTAFIGLLMLVGIVVKNGILLVDYTNTLRKRGVERHEAIMTAGPTRMRPILMTASAAILGMLPLALGIGKGSEIQAPMATAVIGGLMTSTILTLFVVPVVYSLLDDAVNHFAAKKQDATE